MDILAALKEEESNLQRQLTAIRGAVVALNGSTKATVSSRQVNSSSAPTAKRAMSAAARAKISRAAKARWAKFRAAKAKNKK
jgi:hypothetical protein